MARRAGSGRPHKGVDLFAEAGSPVLSAAYGRVLRVVDGRTADPKKQEGLARAGLFVDVRALSVLMAAWERAKRSTQAADTPRGAQGSDPGARS